MDATELPENWQLERSSDDGLCTGIYLHEYLQLEMNIVAIEEMNQHYFDIHLSWDTGFGGVEGMFELDDEITSNEDAKNWALALMQQIDRQFEPQHKNYVTRAMQATRGETLEPPRVESVNDDTDCPVCNAPFFQFRGFDTLQQAKNHIEYMDDEIHENMNVSLERVP